MFYRGDRAITRVRFTLAHELGHVCLGWHVGTIGCSPSVPPDVVAKGSAPVVWSRAEYALGEREASEFASQVVLPWTYVNDLAVGHDMDTVLRGVDAANVSAFAGLVGLSQMLQPGFVFVFDPNDGHGTRQIASRGTHYPDMIAGRPNLQELRSVALESGRTEVSGRNVRWFRLANFEALPPKPLLGSRELLADALAPMNLEGAERAILAKRIQSITAGILSVPRGNIDQALAAVRHRFSVEPDVVGIPPDRLDTFLVAKVHERFKSE